jgi:hypothetical protein
MVLLRWNSTTLLMTEEFHARVKVSAAMLATKWHVLLSKRLLFSMQSYLFVLDKPVLEM